MNRKEIIKSKSKKLKAWVGLGLSIEECEEFVESVIDDTEIASKTDSIDLVSESSELAKIKEERDQYRNLWQKSQKLKRELIKKYNLPIADATLD